MIYLFAGDDIKNKTINYERFMESTLLDLEVFYINRNNFDQMQIENFFSGAGLFFDKCIVVFSEILENENAKVFILEKLENISESKNLFIFLERDLSKSILDSFKKVRAELNIFELSREKKEKYNNFLLTYDFEKRDKLNLWIHFRQAIEIGVGMEELVGVLFWKAKDMILKKNFNKFSEDELKNFASKISYLLPEARKNDIDAETYFEKFLLDFI